MQFVIEFKIKEKMHIEAIKFLMCLEVLEERGFLFSWERLGMGFWETNISSKAIPKMLNMKYKSEFKHGFTNRRCLQCAILKALHSFQ